MNSNQAQVFCSLFFSLVAVVFLALKWSGVIGWDYVWVLSPWWMPAACGGALYAVLLVVAGCMKIAEDIR